MLRHCRFLLTGALVVGLLALPAISVAGQPSKQVTNPPSMVSDLHDSATMGPAVEKDPQKQQTAKITKENSITQKAPATRRHVIDSPSTGASVNLKGLRDGGDISGDFYNAFDLQTTYDIGWSRWGDIQTNDFGEDVFIARPVVPGKTYAIEEVGFQLLRVTSTTVETWARITVYDSFYTDVADDYTYDNSTCPSGDPMVHSSNILGQAVFNLGTDVDELCNTWDRYILNLVTGEVYDEFEGAIDTNLYMISNTSPTGYISAGLGGNNPIFVTIELGTGSNDDPATFTDAPADDCTDTFPGGQLAFFAPEGIGEFGYFEKVELNTLADTFAGATGNGYHNDGQEDDNDEWNCGDAIAWPVSDEIDRMWPMVLMLRGQDYPDCNGNGVPDGTDIAGSTSVDVLGPAGTADGIPDECQIGDCNNNNCWDLCDLYPNCVDECEDDPYNTGCGSTPLPDCNDDGVIDSCQLANNDCNNNSIPDDCDIAEGGSSHDCNENGIPEECEFADGLIPDCNENGEPDSCDIDSLNGQPAYSPDCDDNDIPDECQIRSDSPAPGGPFFCTNGCSADCDFTGVPDHCERFVRDCNYNGLDDYCDIHIYGEAVDANTNNIPDLCEMAGKTVMIDFEDKDPVQYPDVENLYDWNYVDGPLNEQPIDEDAGDGSYFYADWSVIEYDDESGEYVGEVTDSDACDAITQTMGSSSTRHMKFKTRAFRPQVAATPQIHMADPNWDVVNAYTPMIQTLSMDVMFEQPSYRVDWDLFVDSIFDDGDNAWNVAIGFSTKEISEGSGTYYSEIDVYHDLDAIHTGVSWFTAAGDVHELKIEVDFGRTLGYFADAGKVYWDGTEIATFTPRIDYDTGLLPVMDRVSFQNDSNGFTNPVGSSYFHVDNIELYHSDGSVDCEAYMSDDCDGNGICDVFDLQYFTDIDENNNGVIDECEWKCNDCNFNGIIDDVEIADGSALDLNGNGIMDGCEVLSDIPVPGDGAEGVFGFNSSDGFVDGLELSPWGDAAKYSGGWSAIGFASQAVISSDSGVNPTEGDMFLQVKADPTDGGIGWITGPRQQASDNDIEIWCWDMHVNQLGFDAVYVEIADFCEDGADTYEDYRAALNTAASDMLNYSASTGANYPPVYAGVNTGVAIRGNDGLIAFQEYASATGEVTYESAGENIELNQWGTFAIVVENSTGNTWLFYDADGSHDICSRDLIGFEQMSSSSARPLYYQQYLSENTEAPDSRGDKQLHIRTTLLEDGAANVKFSFDNFRYLAFNDCDANSLPDEYSIESSQVSDWNSDGVPDNCQDCDDSCAGLWDWDITPARRKSLTITQANAQSCVDSFQIATDPDCNGNGQIDACELDATLPYVGAEVAANNCGGTSPNVGCWQYRDADKACDADATGVMDACEADPELDWDCNGNGCFDTAEIAAGTALDVDDNGQPDECMVDCNLNNRDDALDIGQQVGEDYVSCDLWPPTNAGDGIPDECCMKEILPGLYEPAEPNPDFDGDGDIDVNDYRRLQECEGVLAGSVPRLNTDPPSCLGADTSIGGLCPKCHCGCADFNKDGVVDEADVLYFKLRMTGP